MTRSAEAKPAESCPSRGARLVEREQAVAAWRPLCMDEDDYLGWRDASRFVYGGRLQKPCVDCPLAYAAEMRALGRCNGSPGDVADEDVSDEPSGALRGF